MVSCLHHRLASHLQVLSVLYGALNAALNVIHELLIFPSFASSSPLWCVNYHKGPLPSFHSLLKFIYLYFTLICMSILLARLCIACVPSAQGSQTRASDALGLELLHAMGGCKPPCAFWEPNSGALQDQQLLIRACLCSPWPLP